MAMNYSDTSLIR